MYSMFMCCCVSLLPVGVLEVNSGSKWNVSSGLPTVGLKGGLISFLYNFCKKQNNTELLNSKLPVSGQCHPDRR